LPPEEDETAAPANGGHRPRGRNALVAELYYFAGKLGRGRVCALTMSEGGAPQVSGVSYAVYDPYEGWQKWLLKALEEAGYHIDWGKALRRAPPLLPAGADAPEFEDQPKSERGEHPEHDLVEVDPVPEVLEHRRPPKASTPTYGRDRLRSIEMWGDPLFLCHGVLPPQQARDAPSAAATRDGATRSTRRFSATSRLSSGDPSQERVPPSPPRRGGEGWGEQLCSQRRACEPAGRPRQGARWSRARVAASALTRPARWFLWPVIGSARCADRLAMLRRRRVPRLCRGDSRLPILLAGEHGIEHDEELPQAGDEGDFGLLAVGQQPEIERLEHRVVLRRGAQRRHVEHVAQLGAAALDIALPPALAAIVVEGRDADERGDLATAEAPEFRQPGDDRRGRHRPEAGHAGEPSRQRGHRRMAVDVV